MSDALYDVRIVFRQPQGGGLSALDVGMTEAERDRLCREFAGSGVQGHSSGGAPPPPPGPRGGVYDAVVSGSKRKVALRFEDVLYVW